MTATVFDGRAVAARIKRQTAERVHRLAAQEVRVRLDAILAGDSAAGALFTQSQQRQCREAGIAYHLHTLPAGCTQQDVTGLIRQVNDDPDVTGILLNLPLPAGLDTPAAQYCIDPYKDIEGVNPTNIGMLFYNCPIMAPCTSVAVLEVVRELGCEVRGMHAVVIGMGTVTGRPMALNLMQQDATVTACNVYTKNLRELTRQADILVATAGVPGLVTADHVKPGSIVIDVGINRVPVSPGSDKTKVVGDVRFDEVREVASVITPVPGGVGPVTVAVVLRAATEAAERQRGPRRLDV
jgi:methylenetetrahydrofolate dehydrogenase (NADP+)/methenyltetrahydrofolate cyclohydrolase